MAIIRQLHQQVAKASVSTWSEIPKIEVQSLTCKFVGTNGEGQGCVGGVCN